MRPDSLLRPWRYINHLLNNLKIGQTEIRPVVAVLVTELHLNARRVRQRRHATVDADRRDDEQSVELTLNDALVVPGETERRVAGRHAHVIQHVT